MITNLATVIIPWCDRPELERTLRHNAPLLQDVEAEILVVNCGASPEALRRIVRAAAIERVGLIDIPAREFNKSLSLNVGIHHAGHETLLLLDADILLTGSIRPLVEACAQGDRFIVFNGVVEHPAPALPPLVGAQSFLRGLTWEGYSTFVWADGTSTTVRRAYQDLGAGRRFGPGLMIVQKRHLLAIDGFSSTFEGWGWEDVDVHLRLQRQLALTPTYVDDEVIHLAHQDDRRDVRVGGRRASGKANFMRGCEAYARGDFSGTYTTDLARWGTAVSREVWSPSNG